jgi:molybdopterin synthase sulfur carrier subunit
MKIRVKCFAALQEITGQREIELDMTADSTAADLLEHFSQLYPQIRRYGNSLMISVNMEFVSPRSPLSEGDEVVFIPPVSGGNYDA